MKIKKTLWIFVLAISIISCKNSNTEADNKEEEKNVFSITLNAIVKKDDAFQVFYKENEQQEFTEENSLNVSLKGSENAQDIVFKLPEDVIPNYIRFDYGSNKDQSEIKINNLRLNYNGKSFEIKDVEFINYISLNPATIKYDASKFTITPIVNKDGSIDPMSFSGEAFFKQVQTLEK